MISSDIFASPEPVDSLPQAAARTNPDLLFCASGPVEPIISNASSRLARLRARPGFSAPLECALAVPVRPKPPGRHRVLRCPIKQTIRPDTPTTSNDRRRDKLFVMIVL